MIMDARVRAGWIEATRRPRAESELRRGRWRLNGEGQSIAQIRKAEERGSERTCIVTGEKGRRRRCCALRCRRRRRGHARHPPQAAGSRRLDAARAPRSWRAPPRRARFRAAFARRPKPRPISPRRSTRCSSGDALQFLSMVNKAGLVVAGAAKVEAAIEAGDVVGVDLRPATAPPTGPRSWSSGAGPLGERPERRTDKSLLFEPIGFGIGEGKCDTCCAQLGRGERGLPREGRASASISGERGRTTAAAIERRRRAGRRADDAWRAERIG